MVAPAPKGKSRYRSLMIFISLFVLIVVSVLSLNFYASSEVSFEGVTINIAGRQRMLSQKQAKTIPKIFQSQLHNKGTVKAAKEMQSTVTLFDNTLKALTDGGEIIGTNGKKVFLKPVSAESARKILLKTNTEWAGYKKAFDKVLKSDISTLVLLGNANHTAKEVNKELLSSVEHLKNLLIINKSTFNNINVVAQLSVLSQKIPKELNELIHAQTAHEDISKAVANGLRESVYQFDSIMTILTTGGEYTSLSGRSIKIASIEDSNSLKIIEQINKQWLPLSTSTKKMLSHDMTVIKNLSELHTLAHTKNEKLLTFTNDMVSALEQDLSKRSTLLGYIQLGGILLALGMFGFIMTFFMKHLKQADAKLDNAMDENEEILSTINDGLFLIDQDHVIGQQHSKSLSKVINVEEPAGKNFLSILGNIVPDKTIRVADEYLGLLYGDRVHADLVGDLNPLDQVEVYFEDGSFEKRLGYLAFDFKRVTKDGNIPHLLVQVEDISEKVILEKKLEETKGAAQEQFDMMLQVLHVQPKVLVQFLQDTEESLNKINATLQNNSKNSATNENSKEKINSIARYMHRIKGDASGLQLHGFEQKAHEFEDLFAKLKNNPKITGKDYLPVVIKLEEFLKQLGSLRSMIDKLANLKETLNAEEGTELQIDNANGTKMSTILNILVNSVSSRQGKNVILNIFNEHLLPEKYVKPVHDILTQLIRNSIVHGIEDSETRQKFNKTDEGVIAVKFFIDQKTNMLTMKYLDNGRGLRKVNILNSAIEKGLINEKEALGLSKDEIFSLIFKSGFSTKQGVETDAGRGVGMDVVHDLVEKNNGQISVNSIENQIFKIDISLPINTFSSDEKKQETPVLEEA